MNMFWKMTENRVDQNQKVHQSVSSQKSNQTPNQKNEEVVPEKATERVKQSILFNFNQIKQGKHKR